MLYQSQINHLAMKHQSENFRIIKGIKFVNYADLISTDKQNAAEVENAKKMFKKVRVIKHHTHNFSQLFVAHPIN